MSALLTEIVLPQRPPTVPCPTTVTDGDRRSLFVALVAVEDPRDPRGRRYPLVAILAAAVCAVIAGACTFAAVTDWVRFQDRTVWARLGFDGRVPAATTVWRLLIRIDAAALSQVLARWLRSRATPVPDPGHWWRRVIAVDGKVERGARLPDGRQVHLLSAYDTSTGIVLAQVQIAAKSKEIPAFTPLLRLVKSVLGSLDGVLVVADALHAQVGHADLLAEHGAHPMVTASDLGTWARSEWHIENRLHLSTGLSFAASMSTTTVTCCRCGSLFQRYQRRFFNGVEWQQWRTALRSRRRAGRGRGRCSTAATARCCRSRTGWRRTGICGHRTRCAAMRRRWRSGGRFWSSAVRPAGGTRSVSRRCPGSCPGCVTAARSSTPSQLPGRRRRRRRWRRGWRR